MTSEQLYLTINRRLQQYQNPSAFSFLRILLLASSNLIVAARAGIEHEQNEISRFRGNDG